ncbi:MAG: hypothetical protein HUU34_05115 [Saprospiraceae bacterium]|jgi:hypothetical protein|nr:hypothetical protein [Saprospiraceae bacterium]
MRTLHFLWMGLFAMTIMSIGCGPALKLSTIHPDSDKLITFEASRGRVSGGISQMNIEVGGTVVKTQAGENAAYTGGPYAAFSNMQLPYRAFANLTAGGIKSTSGWVYIANPKGVYTYTTPTGSNSGYPNGTNEQTGANLYRLDHAIVRTHALNAVMEYASDKGIDPVTVSNTADHMVAAVAYYVDKHMSWRDDSTNQTVFASNGFASYAPGWDFPQPADLTLRISGNLANADPKDDFMGDCEDHAILRSALLRALGFAPWAIWDAIDNPISHEYNVVLYEGAYRLMDYGEIDRWLDTHSWSAHQSHFGWNEANGPRFVDPVNHDYLKNNTDNFPGGKTCPGAWSYYKYYKDNCK